MIDRFEVGKTYAVAANIIGKCIAVDPSGQFGMICEDGVNNPSVWEARWPALEERREPIRVDGWVPVFRDGSYGPVYKTRNAAKASFPDAIAYVHVTGVEGAE